MKKYLRLLTIAGSDSGGGAGVQADLKTFSALGSYGMSVITALTAQNTLGVQSIFQVSPDFVGSQIDSVLGDIGVDGVKIGMLSNQAIIEVIADRIQHYQISKIVLDPVMLAKSGDALLEIGAIESLKRNLFPLAHLVAPNIPEATFLLERNIETKDDMESAAKSLAAFGSGAVLIKGGHMPHERCDDCLFVTKENKIYWLSSERIQTKNTHGTGCTLSSAIASYLARGFDIPTAVQNAKDYLTKAIKSGAGYQLGRGHGPVHHSF